MRKNEKMLLTVIEKLTKIKAYKKGRKNAQEVTKKYEKKSI
jgi:hypothetical protein